MDAGADAQVGAAERVKDEVLQVGRVQEWWADGRGPAAARRNQVLAEIDENVLMECIAAGGNYHLFFTPDRLDGLYRRFVNTDAPGLEPLRKALQSRGGTKNQARAVGMLLFREARNLFEQSEVQGGGPDSSAGTVPAAPAAPAAQAADAAPEKRPAESAVAPGGEDDTRLDEFWSTPRRYICSDTYPAGATMAVRESPSQRSRLLGKLPDGAEYIATGRVGDFLRIQYNFDGVHTEAYVLHRLDDLVLLKPAATAAAQPAPRAEARAPGADAAQDDVVLDEAWAPPRRFVCSASYPEGAEMSVRAAPRRDSQQLTTCPAGYQYLATGRVGEYLQIRVTINGASAPAYVIHTLGDLVLLVPDAPDVTPVATPAPASAPTSSMMPSPPSKGAIDHRQSCKQASSAAAAVALAAEAANAAVVAEAATATRLEALEAETARMDHEMRALRQQNQVMQRDQQQMQRELSQLRAQLAAVAGAFTPFALAVS